jgi:hypothetical protein
MMDQKVAYMDLLDSFEKSEDFIKLEQKLQMIFQKSNSNRSFKSYQADTASPAKRWKKHTGGIIIGIY